MGIIMISLIPFIIELPLDHLLIKRKKKDLSWKTRTVLIAISCLACWWLEGAEVNISGLRVIGSSVCLALAPFCFFDPLLNLLRFGWKQWRDGMWAYNSITNRKYWDRQFAKLNPWFLLTLRVIGFGLCILGWKVI